MSYRRHEEERGGRRRHDDRHDDRRRENDRRDAYRRVDRHDDRRSEQRHDRERDRHYEPRRDDRRSEPRRDDRRGNNIDERQWQDHGQRHDRRHEARDPRLEAARGRDPRRASPPRDNSSVHHPSTSFERRDHGHAGDRPRNGRETSRRSRSRSPGPYRGRDHAPRSPPMAAEAPKRDGYGSDDDNYDLETALKPRDYTPFDQSSEDNAAHGGGGGDSGAHSHGVAQWQSRQQHRDPSHGSTLFGSRTSQQPSSYQPRGRPHPTPTTQASTAQFARQAAREARADAALEYAETVQTRKHQAGTYTSRAPAPLDPTGRVPKALLEAQEQDPEVMEKRLKQVEITKGHINYLRYVNQVPRHARRPRMPQTPPVTQRMSTRAFRGLLTQWKARLAEYSTMKPGEYLVDVRKLIDEQISDEESIDFADCEDCG